MNKRLLISFILAILFGAFMFVYGEYDDSPGGQLLGFLAVIIGIVGLIKSKKEISTMNIFSNSTFTWWQVGLFKLSVLTFGIAVGAYWQEVFLPYFTPLLVVAFASGAYVAYVYFKQH